ncbi:hypothetical protein D3C84_937640 [compost metagenome]
MAQAVEVDVGPGVDGHEGLAADAALLDIFLDPGHAQGAGRFGDRAGIVVDILDGGTDFVGADGDHLIDIVFADIEGVLTDLGHRHAIGEDAYGRQHHSLASCHGRLQTI